MAIKRSFFGATLATAAFAAVALTPSASSACGGFFCSRSPVDQTAEHIIFTINGDHTVTAYVQIRYAGDKDDFAWIVPAPGIPRLSADLPDLAMRGLDVATEPQYYRSSCNNFAVPGVAVGAGGSASASTPTGQPGVTVLAKQTVGPFDTVTLEGTSADVLVQWLNDNGYRITDKMTPLIQPYVESGMHFVAMKLQADKATTDIKPIGMAYDSDQPLIPIRLTSVAAQPEMGIVTFVLSTRRWAPQNYIDLKIPDSSIQFNQYGNANNYLSLVSSESDKVGGQAFVTEYANPTTDLATQIRSQFVNPSIPDAQASQDALLALFDKFPYITRLYARMSAEEMTEDPVFMVSSNTANVSNVHDLTDPKFDYSMCGTQTPPPPPPCTFTYCGRRGACIDVVAQAPYSSDPTQTAPAAACVCANDATARLTTTGSNVADVYCEPVAVDLDDPATSPLSLAPACEGFDCGVHGACVPINGNPSCQCEAGYAAVARMNYDSTTGATSPSVDCMPAPGPAPALPVVPPVGQTTIPSGSHSSGGASSGKGGAGTGGASSGGTSTGSLPSSGGASGAGSPATSSAAAGDSQASSGGCSVAKDPTRSSVTGFLVALAGVAAARRRRARRAALFS